MACFHRIAPDETVNTRLQQHEDYSADWAQKGTKHNLATAIRMVLTEQVGRSQYDSITSLSKPVLAELIVACRLVNSPTDIEAEPYETRNAAPAIPTVASSQFHDTLELNGQSDAAIHEWISNHRADGDGPHAVYVLDCIPPTGEAESSRLKSLRTTAANKQDSTTLTELERAGAAANQGNRIYYVGYTSDVAARIRQHLRGAQAASARFTNLFEPNALVEVTWFDTELSAKAFEKQRASELTVLGESYAYFN